MLLFQRMKLNEVWRDYESDCIEAEFKREKKNAAREFEEKKIELRESLITELGMKICHVFYLCTCHYKYNSYNIPACVIHILMCT